MKKINFVAVFISIICLVIGFGVLFVCKFFSNMWEGQKAECTDYTTGEVLDIVENMQSDRKNFDHINTDTYTYCALVEYTVNNNLYSVEDSHGYGKSDCPYEVGDTVTVHYNPNDPGEMYLEDGDISTITTAFKIYAYIHIGIAALIIVSSIYASIKARD